MPTAIEIKQYVVDNALPMVLVPDAQYYVRKNTAPSGQPSIYHVDHYIISSTGIPIQNFPKTAIDEAIATIPAGPPGIPGPSAGIESVNIRTLGVYGTAAGYPSENSALQTAIQTKANEKKRIVFDNIEIGVAAVPGGDSLYFNGGNIDMIGSNSSFKFLPRTDGSTTFVDNFFHAYNCPKIFIDGQIEFNMNGAPGNPNFGTRATWFANCPKVYVRGLHLHDNGFLGLFMTDCNDIDVIESTFKNTDSSIIVRDGALRCNVQRCRIGYGVNDTSEGVCFFGQQVGFAYAPRSFNASDNYIQKPTSAAFNVGHCSKGSLYKNYIEGCRVAGFMYDIGSGIPPSEHSEEMNVEGNHIYDCDDGFTSCGSNTRLCGNDFHRMRYQSITTAGYLNSSYQPDPSQRIRSFVMEHNDFFDCNQASGNNYPMIHLYNIDNGVITNNKAFNPIGQSSGSWPGVFMENCNQTHYSNNRMHGTSFTLAGSTDFSSTTNFINDNYHKDYMKFSSGSGGGKVAIPGFGGSTNWELLRNRIMSA